MRKVVVFLVAAAMAVALVTFAVDSGSEQPLPPGAKPRGTGLAADRSGAMPELGDARARALAWILEPEHETLSGLLGMSMLSNRFGVPEFAFAPGKYTSLTQTAAAGDQGLLFRRVVVPNQRPDHRRLREISARLDRLTLPALYCLVKPLPVHYDAALLDALGEGGMAATHAALALAWLEENGCEPAWRALLRLDAVRVLRDLLVMPPDDVAMEAAAFLGLLGEPEKVPAAFVQAVLDRQLPDGSWSEREGVARGDWHTTGLGLWLLLEVGTPPIGGTLSH